MIVGYKTTKVFVIGNELLTRHKQRIPIEKPLKCIWESIHLKREKPQVQHSVQTLLKSFRQKLLLILKTPRQRCHQVRIEIRDNDRKETKMESRFMLFGLR